MRPTPSRVTLPAQMVAVLCGAVAGLVTFAVAAALWRVGRPATASVFSEAVLVACLTALAAVTVFERPTRMRKARVPVGRPVPHAWWPVNEDPLPTLVVCAGAPVAAGATVAALLFH